MAQETTFMNAYFDTLKEHVEKIIKDGDGNLSFNYNFADATVFDRNPEFNNSKGNYLIQGSDLTGYLKRISGNIESAANTHFATQEIKLVKKDLHNFESSFVSK